MRAGLKPFALVLSLALLAGCATPEHRARQYSQKYAALSSEVREAAVQGLFSHGASREAIYVALGAPNRSLFRQENGEDVESWKYLARLDVINPEDSAFMHDLERRVAQYRFFRLSDAELARLRLVSNSAFEFDGLLRGRPLLVVTVDFSAGAVERVLLGQRDPEAPLPYPPSGLQMPLSPFQN